MDWTFRENYPCYERFNTSIPAQISELDAKTRRAAEKLFASQRLCVKVILTADLCDF